MIKGLKSCSVPDVSRWQELVARVPEIKISDRLRSDVLDPKNLSLGDVVQID